MSSRSHPFTVEDRLARLEKAIAGIGSALYRVGGTDRLRQRGQYSLADLMDEQQYAENVMEFSPPVAGQLTVDDYDDNGGRAA